MGDAFTWITGALGAIGAVLQLFDLFPRFAKVRNAAVLVLLGVFLGSLIRAFDGSQIKLAVTLSGVAVVATINLLVIVLPLLAAPFVADAPRREELYAVSGIAALAFMLVGMVALISHSVDSPGVEKARLTISEYNSLADRAVERGDYDRAAMHLQAAQSRINRTDERHEVLEQRIRELRKRELESPPRK